MHRWADLNNSDILRSKLMKTTRWPRALVLYRESCSEIGGLLAFAA